MATKTSSFDSKSALRISQKVIGMQLGDHTVTEVSGKIHNLGEYRGKPLIVSMIYTSCYEICLMTTRHLAKMVKKAQEALGKDSFNMVLIGFDVKRDTPEAMRFFATKQGVDSPPWHLLSIDKNILDSLVRELGFSYFPSSNGYDHILQVTVIDSAGVVYQQIYGQAFEIPLLIEPLKELVLGKPKANQTIIDQLINKVRFFCTTYDPRRGGYYFDYSVFLGMFIGGLIIVLGLFFVGREIYRRKHIQAT